MKLKQYQHIYLSTRRIFKNSKYRFKGADSIFLFKYLRKTDKLQYSPAACQPHHQLDHEESLLPFLCLLYGHGLCLTQESKHIFIIMQVKSNISFLACTKVEL